MTTNIAGRALASTEPVDGRLSYVVVVGRSGRAFLIELRGAREMAGPFG